MSLSTFHSLDWRLEVPVARRMATEARGAEQVAPRYAICLTTSKSAPAVSKAPSEDASVEPPFETHWLTADFQTLREVTKAVEDAVDSLQSQQARRIARLVK